MFTPDWIKDGERHLTLRDLRDLLSRTVAVLDTQHDDNGELLREGNSDLFAELQAAVSLCDDAAMTAGELLLR